MAHADDVEYYAGGTMAKFIDQGYEGVIVLLACNSAGADINGDGKYLGHPPEKVMPVRLAEARAGADILGIKTVEQVGFKDHLYFDGEKLVTLGDPGFDVNHPCGREILAAAAQNERIVKSVSDLLARHEPEIVITHNFSSGFEHTCAAHLVNQAFGTAVKNGASLGSLWVPAHVRHCAWQSDVRLFPSPSVIVDVTAHWERKIAAIRAHKSQRVEKTLERVELICRYWGLARQCRYAEPFFAIHDARYS